MCSISKTSVLDISRVTSNQGGALCRCSWPLLAMPLNECFQLQRTAERKASLLSACRASMTTSSSRPVRSYRICQRCLWSLCVTCLTRCTTFTPNPTMTNSINTSGRIPFHLLQPAQSFMGHDKGCDEGRKMQGKQLLSQTKQFIRIGHMTVQLTQQMISLTRQ